MRYLFPLAFLALTGCSSAQSDVKTVHDVTVIAERIAQDAWAVAAASCIGLADSGVNVRACAQALVPAHNALVKAEADITSGVGTICSLAPLVPSLRAAYAVPGVGSKLLDDAVDALDTLVAVCPADAGAEAGAE